MARSSREKGKRGEREVAQIYTDAGIPCKRAGNALGYADCIGVPGIHIEVKRTEKLQMWSAIEQSEADAPAGQVPTVHFRRSRSQWYVALPLTDFIELLKPPA